LSWGTNKKGKGNERKSGSGEGVFQKKSAAFSGDNGAFLFCGSRAGSTTAAGFFPVSGGRRK
jgi:hypothetical protein